MPRAPLWFVLDVAVALLLVFIAQNKLAHYQEQKKLQDQQANMDMLGAYAIVINWPNGSHDDVDLWVEDPNGGIVFFRAKEVDVMHLERDDLGTNDTVVDQKTGQTIAVEKREERVVLRGILPGEYIVNVHMYSKRDPGPTEVTAKLVNLKVAGKEETQQKVTLVQYGDEKTMFRFTLTPAGEVGNINYLEKKFVGNARSSAGTSQGGGP